MVRNMVSCIMSEVQILDLFLNGEHCVGQYFGNSAKFWSFESFSSTSREIPNYRARHLTFAGTVSDMDTENELLDSR